MKQALGVFGCVQCCSCITAWCDASLLAACRQRINPLDEIAQRVKQGPLLQLRGWYTQRQRVRVVTRHERGIRGTATGTLLAFDKHFNLVLRDVQESYTVLLRVERGGRWCRQQERRHRSLKQVFIAGSSVVVVSLAGAGGGVGEG